MFYKTLKSTKIASYIQTALYSAAQNAVNPHHYMQAILDNKQAVIHNPDAWLPWNYQESLYLKFQKSNAFLVSSVSSGLVF